MWDALGPKIEIPALVHGCHLEHGHIRRIGVILIITGQFRIAHRGVIHKALATAWRSKPDICHEFQVAVPGIFNVSNGWGCFIKIPPRIFKSVNSGMRLTRAASRASTVAQVQP